MSELRRLQGQDATIGLLLSLSARQGKAFSRGMLAMGTLMKNAATGSSCWFRWARILGRKRKITSGHTLKHPSGFRNGDAQSQIKWKVTQSGKNRPRSAAAAVKVFEGTIPVSTSLTKY